ncbi:MAG: ferritin-like domain-containing protein [Chloroflexia bacterium]
MSNVILPGDSGHGISRRQFLIGSGALAGTLAFFGMAGLNPARAAGLHMASAAGLNSDMDILLFALTLEHVEDAAYRAANGSGLLSGKVADYFKAFGDHEHAHVVALTDTINKLGGTPVAEQAAYNFPSFGSQDDVVKFFAQVEEVGAGAYLGAAPLLQNKDLLAAAVSIHNVEAQHASTLRAVMGDAMPTPAFGSPLTYDQVLAAVGPLLQAPAAPTAAPAPTSAPAPANTPTPPTPGMPGTGNPDSTASWLLAAGVGAAAVGAYARSRSRNAATQTEGDDSQAQ